MWKLKNKMNKQKRNRQQIDSCQKGGGYIR